MNIMVTDGENRSALAVIRSLGRRGCSVFVSGSKLGNISAYSKFCHKAFVAPDPLDNSNYYAQAIAEIVKKEHIDVLFPMTEQSIYCINMARSEFGESVILACATPEKMEAVSNKYKLFQLAEKLGVAIPETIYVTDADDFNKKIDCVAGYPVVVKPFYSKIIDNGRIISSGVMFAYDSAELRRLYEIKPVLRHPSLIQKLIVGEGTGLFTLFDNNRHLALFSHRRLLEKPPSGGVSVLSESIPLDGELVEAASRLLSAVAWRGIAMVEFKRDKSDHKAKLMEINGRFWGSLQLAVSSGVDYPSLCLDYYLGKQPDFTFNYTVGYRLKWLLGILDHLLIRLKYSPKELNLPPGSHPLWQVVSDLVTFGGSNTSFDVYDRNDPDPFWHEARSYFRQIMRGKR